MLNQQWIIPSMQFQSIICANPEKHMYTVLFLETTFNTLFNMAFSIFDNKCQHLENDMSYNCIINKLAKILCENIIFTGTPCLLNFIV